MAREHGTYVKYVQDRCRCEDCRKANRESENRRTRLKAYRKYDLVDAEPARVHIRQLGMLGMGWKRVAQAAGLHHSAVGSILYGRFPHDPAHPEHRPPRRQIHAEIERRILDVHLEIAAGQKIVAAGTVRRLRALVAIGHTQASLAEHLGLTPTNFSPLIHAGETNLVTAGRAAQVRELYDELWDVPGPSALAIARGREFGWACPLAWDDETIDDLSARPAIDGQATQSKTADRLEDIEFLLDQGTPPSEIAERLGIDLLSLRKWLARLDNNDLLRRLSAGAGAAE